MNRVCCLSTYLGTMSTPWALRVRPPSAVFVASSPHLFVALKLLSELRIPLLMALPTLLIASYVRRGLVTDIYMRRLLPPIVPSVAGAAVTCEAGCSCEPSVLDGHIEPHNSQHFMHRFGVTQAENCEIVVTVAEETKSAEHKVEIPLTKLLWPCLTNTKRQRLACSNYKLLLLELDATRLKSVISLTETLLLFSARRPWEGMLAPRRWSLPRRVWRLCR